jgi:hypothetical protein
VHSSQIRFAGWSGLLLITNSSTAIVMSTGNKKTRWAGIGSWGNCVRFQDGPARTGSYPRVYQASYASILHLIGKVTPRHRPSRSREMT